MNNILLKYTIIILHKGQIISLMSLQITAWSTIICKCIYAINILVIEIIPILGKQHDTCSLLQTWGDLQSRFHRCLCVPRHILVSPSGGWGRSTYRPAPCWRTGSLPTALCNTSAHSHPLNQNHPARERAKREIVYLLLHSIKTVVVLIITDKARHMDQLNGLLILLEISTLLDASDLVGGGKKSFKCIWWYKLLYM